MGADEDRYTVLADQAKRAFEKHVFRSESEGRWLLQCRHKDGGWDSTMWVEIICLAGNGIYVGGDIDHLIFRYGPEDHLSRIFWIGRKKAWDSYVQQKASIGMDGDRRNIVEWNDAVAKEDLLRIREELLSSGDAQWVTSALESVDDAIESIGDGQGEVYRTLMSDNYFSEDPPEIGFVTSTRLIYVMAALNRLCVLLEEKHGTGHGTG